MSTLVARTALPAGLHAARRRQVGLQCRYAVRLPVLQDRVRRREGRRGARDRHHGRLPGHRAAGADARAGDPAPARAGRRLAREGRARPSWSTWSRPPPRWPSWTGSARATGWCSTPVRPPTRPSSTRTCTCSAAARWAGRRDEPAAYGGRGRPARTGDGGLLHRQRRHAPGGARRRVTDDRDAEPGRGRPRGTREAEAAAVGGAPGEAGDAGGVHAVRALRHRHRRLPVLRARPAPDAGRLHHRPQHPARHTVGRAPRDPLPAAAVRGGRRRGQGRRRAGRGVDLLRGHRSPDAGRVPRRRALAGRLGAGRLRAGDGRRRRCAHGARARR